MLKLHSELPDCLSLPKSDGTPGDGGHPVNLNSLRRGVTSEGKPDAKEEKQQDGGGAEKVFPCTRGGHEIEEKANKRLV